MSKQLGQYVRLLKQWWWLLIISALIPAVIANVLLSRQLDAYQAKTTLAVGSSLQNPQPDPWQLNVANTLANAYARLAREGPVIQAVVDRLGLERRPDQLTAQITTRVYPEAQLLEIQVVDTDPRVAALIANALADELVRRSPVSQEDQAQRQVFIRGQLDDLEARIERLDAEIEELQASLVDLTSAAQLEEAQNRLSQLETVKVNLQTTYASLLESLQTEVPNVVSIFEAAVEPVTPLPRRDMLITAVAGAAGLALAVAGVVLAEYLDDAVRWEGDARQSLLGMPSLGAIPSIANGEGSIVDLVDPLSHGAEMVRALRTNIFIAAGDKSPQVLLLTSPTLSDGKTFVVAQLALAIAGGGKRVIMIDADLRKPTLHELFDLPNVYGLSELLGGRTRLVGTAWPKGTLQTGAENLYLLPAGRPPVDPSRLLTSPRLRKLLNALKKQADVVLIDSPPELVAPDAAVLASAADGTVLVVRAGSTSAGKAQRAKEHLTGRDGVRLLGVTFNQVKMNGDSYYYGPTASGPRRRRRSFWLRLRARLPFLRSSAQPESEIPLSLPDMAAYLGVSRATVRRWCKSGRLPAKRRWWGWSIPEGQLVHFAGTQTQSPDTSQAEEDSG